MSSHTPGPWDATRLIEHIEKWFLYLRAGEGWPVMRRILTAAGEVFAELAALLFAVGMIVLLWEVAR